MRCDDALCAISAAADGELNDDETLALLDAHVAQCAGCARFERTINRVRSQLRFESIGTVPQVWPRIMANLPPRPAMAGGFRGHVQAQLRERGRVVAAAAAVIALVAGATFVALGGGSHTPAAAADIQARILTAQRDIMTVDAEFDLVEQGRPDQPNREGLRGFDGHLSYQAPESLALTLTEQDAATQPAAGDVQLVVRDEQWSLDAVRSCADCPDGVSDWQQTVIHREPFSEAAPIPLELITAVDSFALTAALPQLGERTIAGRSALGVRVAAAQVARFLDALSPAGDLRPVYPTDPVDVWLDREHLVPLAVEVRAEDSQERTQWAETQDFRDEPNEAVLAFSVTSVDINDDNPADVTPVPVTEHSDPVKVQDEGFHLGEVALVPEPALLPDGFRPHLSGTVITPGGPSVGVRSWTDGRAWVKLRATEGWDDIRLFGDLGAAVRVVDLGDAGKGYISADGHKVALHTDDLDLVVTGTLASNQLRAIAASLGLEGLPTPAGWWEAGTATLNDARETQPGLLIPRGLDGFAAPGIRISDGVVTQVYAGPGDRGFVLTQTDTPELSPQSEADSLAVQVRGTVGRYSVQRGELEWIENDTSYSVSSPTLSAAELIGITETLGTRNTNFDFQPQRGAENPKAEAALGFIEASPLPAPSPSVLLAWTPSMLDATLPPAADSVPGVGAISVVQAAITDLVATRDSDGRMLQELDGGWAIPLDTVAIDPATHAGFASLADRATVAALRNGEALLSRSSAALRGLAPGGTIELAGGARLVVAGVVEDTTIGAAELAVTTATGATMGVDVPRYMLLAHSGDRVEVEAALRAALTADVPVRFRAPGVQTFMRHGDAVLPPLRLKERFGEFAYKPAAQGERAFQEDRAWRDEYLVERDLPIVGRMTCHRAMVDALEGALREIQSSNLAQLIQPDEFDGCWQPRLVSPGGDLSHFAWGVAFDLNSEDNPSGMESVQDRRLVDIFARWGFTSGAHWLVPQAAHFEFAQPQRN